MLKNGELKWLKLTQNLISIYSVVECFRTSKFCAFICSKVFVSTVTERNYSFAVSGMPCLEWCATRDSECIPRHSDSFKAH